MSIDSRVAIRRRICLRETRHANSKFIGRYEADNVFVCNTCRVVYAVPATATQRKYTNAPAVPRRHRNL